MTQFESFDNASGNGNYKSFPVSDTEYPSESCNVRLILGSIFAAMAIFFAIYGSVMYAIPVAQYNKNKKNNPNASYFKVPAGYSVMHWIFIAVAIGAMIGAAFISFKGNFMMLLIPMIFFGIVWITYGIVIGTSGIYRASSHIRNNQYFEQYANSLTTAKPYLVIDASATKLNRSYKNVGQCRFRGYKLYATSWDDASHLIVLDNESKLILVESKVTLNIQNKESVEAAKSAILGELNSKCGRKGLYMCQGWSLSVQDSVDGLEDFVFVSMNGNVPKRFNKASRILKAMFWAGTGYNFDLAASSSYVTYSVEKNNVIIDTNIDTSDFSFRCM